jgi:hypothetical protein
MSNIIKLSSKIETKRKKEKKSCLAMGHNPTIETEKTNLLDNCYN